MRVTVSSWTDGVLIGTEKKTKYQITIERKVPRNPRKHGGHFLAGRFWLRINKLQNSPNECEGASPPDSLSSSRPRSKTPLPPEVLERRRAQLRVARRVLDRSMAEPILNASGVVASIGKSIAAGVPEYIRAGTGRAKLTRPVGQTISPARRASQRRNRGNALRTR
jgi:hypothetical protein